MSCVVFLRWLDAGMPQEGAAEAVAHAERCARCAEALRAARAVEALLASDPPAVPEGFAGRVMDRIAAEPARAPAWVPAATPVLPWWARIAADPASVLAFVLLGLVLLRIDRLAAYAGSLAQMPQGLGLPLPAASAPLWTALWLIALPPLLLGGLALYRGSERLLTRWAGA